MLYNLKALYHVIREANLPRSKLDIIIRKRMKDVLVSAARYVPYYRELMRNIGYNPEKEFSGPEDLSILPILTKEKIKENPSALLMQHVDTFSCFMDYTSGSTGIPLTVFRRPYERAVQIAKWLRVLFVNGYYPNYKVMPLTAPHRLSEGKSCLQSLGLLRRLPVDYLLSPEEMVDRLLAYKPDVLYGNRTHLDLMALELRQRNEKSENLKMLIGTGEVFRDTNRALYRDTFGLKLIESYGSVELGVMAYETQEHDGLKLCEDLTYFEFLNDNGKPVPPGVPGRVIVTDLMGGVMPLIRYDHGDHSIYEALEDTHGDSIRRLKKILGRDEEYVTLPDGTHLTYHMFYHCLGEYQGILQYRLVQRREDFLELLLVGDSSYISRVRNEIRNRIERELPSHIGLRIRQVERIAPDPSGKIRVFVSQIEK